MTEASGTERQYRRALRWYPTAWRLRNEEIALATLLDLAEAEGRTAPSVRETMNLAINGMAARSSLLLPAAVRDLISAVGLGAGVLLALVFSVAFSSGRFAADAALGASGDTLREFGPFADPGILVYTLWLIALIMAVARRWRAVRFVIVVAATAPALIRATNALLGEIWAGPMATTLGVMTLLALVVLMGTPRRLSHVAASVFVTGGALAMSVLRFDSERSFWMSVSTSVFPLLVVAAVGASIVLGIARRPAAAGVTLAIAGTWMLLVAVNGVRAHPEMVVFASVAGALAVTVALAVRIAIRHTREALGQTTLRNR